MGRKKKEDLFFDDLFDDFEIDFDDDTIIDIHIPKETLSNEMLSYFKKHVGEWTCVHCATDGKSNHTASTMSDIRRKGYEFEKSTVSDYGKTMFCPKCNCNRTHYKLLSLEPKFEDCNDLGLTQQDREYIIKILGNKDAFDGHTCSQKIHLDHKIPVARMILEGKKMGKILDMSKEEVEDNFQVISPEHNYQKREMCRRCIETGKRGYPNGIPFYYTGDENYVPVSEGGHGCTGCGLYDGKCWRKCLIEKLKSKGLI